MLKTISMLKGQTREAYLERVLRWVKAEYKLLREDPEWKYCHESHPANKAMTNAEKKFIDLGTFGTEGSECAGKSLSYLNAGDTYELTICWTEEDGFFVSTWGDWTESTEQEHCEEEDVIRCGYCSEFTPKDSGPWHEIVCESCGHKVGGD